MISNTEGCGNRTRKIVAIESNLQEEKTRVHERDLIENRHTPTVEDR